MDKAAQVEKGIVKVQPSNNQKVTRDGYDAISLYPLDCETLRGKKNGNVTSESGFDVIL